MYLGTIREGWDVVKLGGGDKQNSKNGWVTNNGGLLINGGFWLLCKLWVKPIRFLKATWKIVIAVYFIRIFLRLHPQTVNMTCKLKKVSDKLSSGRLPICKNCRSWWFFFKKSIQNLTWKVIPIFLQKLEA